MSLIPSDHHQTCTHHFLWLHADSTNYGNVGRKTLVFDRESHFWRVKAHLSDPHTLSPITAVGPLPPSHYTIIAITFKPYLLDTSSNAHYIRRYHEILAWPWVTCKLERMRVNGCIHSMLKIMILHANQLNTPAKHRQVGIHIYKSTWSISS